MNPLLSFEDLPRFEKINATHIEAAVLTVLSQNRAQLSLILANEANRVNPDWDSLMGPLDEMEDRLSKVWSTVSHLNGVCNTAEIREEYNKCQPMITEYYTSLGQNRDLFETVRRLADRADALGLDASQRKILKDYLLEFQLAGVDLDDERKKLFAAVEAELSKLATRFSNNVLDATMAWGRQVEDVEQLTGLSESALQAALETAKRKDKSGYMLTLDAPSYIAIMTNADNRELRKEMYEAYVTRASELATHTMDWDNRAVIEEILTRRAELARLLGYSSYAEISVARKMAKSVTRVNEFLDDLAAMAVPAARLEYEELCAFAAKEHGLTTLEAWDVPYYSEKLRKRKFDISQEELRPYFPVEKVKTGLFTIANKIYGVEIRKNITMAVWDDSVDAFDILREGKVIARFFFDLYIRDGKRSGAWMAECRSRRLLPDGSVQIPVAYLVCNFAPGTDKAPALLTHNEVTTLFHEFGHGLHHMLTKEIHLRSAGINGVAWDAVELPSQLMENWCWDGKAVSMISAHHQTGETLPQRLLDKLLDAKNFQAGMRTVRQLEFALFDFQIHQLSGVVTNDQVSQLMQTVRAQTAAYPVPEFNRFQNSFAHIFAGGYAAGYYSYKWAEVLSADVFSRFSEMGVFNADAGNLFLDKVLSRGGGADPLELFTDFMGREPKIESLLRQDGLLR